MDMADDEIEFPATRTLSADLRTTILSSASAFSGSSTKASAYSLIDKEISTLYEIIRSYEEEIRKWKKCRNRLSIIHRLPTEILLQIFALLSGNSGGGANGLLKISKVCTSWRQILFDHPSLWNRPYLGKEDLAADRKRAYPGPLLVEIDCQNSERWSQWSHWGNNNVQDIKGISDRWSITEAISFDHLEEYDSLHSDLRAAFQRPAPSLETIIMSFHTPEPRSLPATIVGHTERLRHIHIQNWNILLHPAPFGPISSLTTLELCVDDKENAGSQQISVRDLPRALSCFPNAELLKFDNILRPADDEDVAWSEANPLEKVELLSLRQIDILADLRSFAILFKHMVYPSQAIVFGGGYWDDGTDADVTAMAEFARQTTIVGDPIHALRLSVRDYPEESIFEAEILTAQLPVGWARDKATITVHAPPRPEVVTQLCQVLRLDSLQEVAFFLSPKHPLDIDWQLLGQLPSLRFLTLGPLIPAFLTALQRGYSSEVNQSIFTSLEGLRVLDTKFVSRRSHDNDPSSGEDSFGCIRTEDFVQAISDRRRQIHGPYSLYIDQETTDISSDDSTLLKTVFRDVYTV